MGFLSLWLAARLFAQLFSALEAIALIWRSAGNTAVACAVIGSVHRLLQSGRLRDDGVGSGDMSSSG